MPQAAVPDSRADREPSRGAAAEDRNLGVGGSTRRRGHSPGVSPALPRPDPVVARLAHDSSLALAWNAPLDAVHKALGVGVFADEATPRWLHARLALSAAEIAAELRAVLDAHPPRFPAAVPFPLARVDVPAGGGAIGFAACRHGSAPADAAPAIMTDSAHAVLAWLGANVHQTLCADLAIPDDCDGGSAALAILIAGLLAAEPELLPEGWGKGVEAHRFAATGGFATQPQPSLVGVTADTLPAKMRTLVAYGYRTLFVVAPAAGEDLPPTPPGLELVPLPRDPAHALATLRAWFVARLPTRRRLARARQRHGRAVLIGSAVLVALAALAIVLRVQARQRAYEQAKILVAEAEVRASYADHLETVDLLRRANALAPEAVPPGKLAAAEADAATIVATAPGPFAQVEPAFVVDGVSSGSGPSDGVAAVFGSTPATWARWSLRTGEVLWSEPRESDAVTFMHAGEGGVALIAQRSGRLHLRDVRSGRVLQRADFGAIPATGALTANRRTALIAGEEGIAVWPLCGSALRPVAGVRFALGDGVLLAPDGDTGAIVHADGTASLVSLARAALTRQAAGISAAERVGATLTLLDARAGCAWHLVARADDREIVAWDVFTARELRRVVVPEGWDVVAALGDPRTHAPVVLAARPDTRDEVVLFEWPTAAGAPAPSPPRHLPLPAGLAHAGPLAWADPRRIVAFTFSGQPLIVDGSTTTFAGKPFSFGTLVPIHLDAGIDEVPGHLLTPTCAAADPDGDTFVTGCADGILRWWSARDLTPRGARRLAPTAIIGCWFDAGRILAVLADGRLLALQADGQGPVATLLQFPSRLGLAAFDATCRRLVVAPEPDWPMTTPPSADGAPWIQKSLQPGEAVPDGVIAESGRAWFADLAATLPSFTQVSRAPTAITALAVLPSGALALAGALGQLDVRASRAAAAAPGRRILVNFPPTTLAPSPTGSLLAVGDAAGRAHIVNAGTLRLFTTLDPRTAESVPTAVTSVAWGQEDLTLYAAHGLLPQRLAAAQHVVIRSWRLTTGAVTVRWRFSANGCLLLPRIPRSTGVVAICVDRNLRALLVR